ncbi:MAG: phosphate acyltransferase PlsX, partial [Synergistaceae bacterium]|nr:phosphate acyltransferase PlsX [Synergistaceae bacterium]
LKVVSREVLNRIRIVHAAEVIAMDEQPATAIRKKRDSSIRVAMEMVRAGEAQGCLSAGNTGAIVAGGVLVVGRLPTIDRPALGVPLPTINRWTFLLDVGASVRSKPVNLYQYAQMGNVYSKKILGVAEPEIALLSNGTEEIKGDDTVAEAREILCGSPLNFKGYVEGDDIPWGRADVVVCDGFMGNVILKFGEGLMQGAKSIIDEEMGHRFMPKIGVLFMIPMVKALWARFNYEKYGGTPLLGVNGTVVKAHGRSKAPAILGALTAARNFIVRDGVGQIREELE